MVASQIAKGMGIKSAPHHAGLKEDARKQTQRDWTEGPIKTNSDYSSHVWDGDRFATCKVCCSLDSGKECWRVLSVVLSGRAWWKVFHFHYLFYSKDVVSKFSYSIRKPQDKKQSQGKSTKVDNRSLDALQGMGGYCTKHDCRHTCLLKHFGEVIENHLCNKSCDYCQNPSKVEEAVLASEVGKQVVASASLYRHSTTRNGLKHGQE